MGSGELINGMNMCQKGCWIMIKVTRYYEISTYKKIMALKQEDMI